MRRFDQFFEAEYEGIVRSLALAFGDLERAEDAAQDAFARAYQRWRHVGGMDRPGSWVYVVALRAERRKLGRVAEAWKPEVPDGFDNEAAVLDGVTVAKALDTLTQRQRYAVVMRYYADLTIEEVAQAMGCAPGTVKATLHTALRRLRVQFHEQEVAGAN